MPFSLLLYFFQFSWKSFMKACRDDANVRKKTYTGTNISFSFKKYTRLCVYLIFASSIKWIENANANYVEVDGGRNGGKVDFQWIFVVIIFLRQKFWSWMWMSKKLNKRFRMGWKNCSFWMGIGKVGKGQWYFYVTLV